MSEFVCSTCGQTKQEFTGDNKHCPEFGTDSDGRKHCWDCCGARDRQRMIDAGVISLYLTHGKEQWERWVRLKVWATSGHTVSNWPGSLRFNCFVSRGKHNMARVQYLVRFRGPDGFWWSGRVYGDNTQLGRFKRTKEKFAT